jgi:hypothetical protein
MIDYWLIFFTVVSALCAGGFVWVVAPSIAARIRYAQRRRRLRQMRYGLRMCRRRRP